MTQGRGELTQRIKDKSKELMGKEITVRGLRFIAYVQYVLVNDKKIDIEKINGDEVLILNEWFQEGWLSTDDNRLLVCTREFWDILCEIVYLGYVDLQKEKE